MKQLDDVLPVVLHHHEQWDGKGYPHGLAGEQIPLMARIVAVADSFDAMSSDRPYRKGMPDDRLDAIMREGAGSQWDARVVDAFFCARDDIREISEGASVEASASTVAGERNGALRALSVSVLCAAAHISNALSGVPCFDAPICRGRFSADASPVFRPGGSLLPRENLRRVC